MTWKSGYWILASFFVATLVVGCGDEDPQDAPADTGVDAGTEADVGNPDVNVEPDTSGGEVTPPYEDCTVTVGPGEDATQDYEALQGALIEAASGDVVCLVDGDYSLEQEISLTVSGVEIRGQSQEGVRLDFVGQTAGSNGIYVQNADDFKISHLTVANTPGDGIRVEKGARVTFDHVTVVWDRGAHTDNGAYGLYPVECTDVIVENSIVSGASDAGIYVGQSENIIVRHNEVFANVAGIEIENSNIAEVHNNYAHGNTGGILIFNLPNLTMKGGERTKVHNNRIIDNNQANFAPPRNIVALVPQGSGMLIIAADQAEIHDNEFSGNQSVGLAIVSYQTTGRDYEDEDYDPFSEGSFIHDNTFVNNGYDPQGLVFASTEMRPVPPILWDGVFDPDKDNDDGGLTNCYQDNVDEDGAAAAFINLNIGLGSATTDIEPYLCAHDPLPAVTIGD